MNRLAISLFVSLWILPATAVQPSDLPEEDLLGEEELDDLPPVQDTGEDLLGGDAPGDKISRAGQDTSQIYRDAVDDYASYPPDEEMRAWETYLQKYPNAIYKDRIQKRLDDLESQMYRQRIGGQTEQRLDGDQREVPISQGLLIENINPTTRVLAGFEWGIPDYINLMGDFEYGITRQFSVHAGIRNRFMVWNLETGVHYALIKSARTQTLLTLIGDVRVAMNPAYVAFRPQVGFGKMVGRFDFQAQAGVDLEARGSSAVRLIGGANVTGRINESVAVFVETNYNTKNLTWDQGRAFQFPVASFGLKLYPTVGDKPPGFMEINLGASIPYATRYYRWHEGSIMGQLNFYL